MAISSACVWEVRTTGASTNGGGFITGATGTDYSQQNAAQYALTSLASSGSGNVVLSASAAANMVGNIAQVISGTNFTVDFFEITAVSVGVSITFGTSHSGASICTGVGANGVINIGGAFAFGTAKDTTIAAAMQPGHIMWIAGGTHTTVGGSMTFTDASNLKPCYITGYNSARGDNPTGSNRPTVPLGATTNTLGAVSQLSNIISTGTAASPWSSDGQCVWANFKMTNISNSTNRNAITMADMDLVVNSELISWNGVAVNCTSDAAIVGCYIHASSTGIKSTSSAGLVSIADCIIENCSTFGINVSAANTGIVLINSNTIYGAEGQQGTLINLASTADNVRIINNILYGGTVGISAVSANANLMTSNNCFNNNGTNVSNWATTSTGAAATVSTANPTFASVGQYTGSTATTTTTVLTDSGANFANVVANRDFLYISATTGGTTGIYPITATTTTTLTVNTNSMGTGSSVHYSVVYGHNFALSNNNLSNLGFPGAFPAGFTTGYMDVGAVQKYPVGGGSFVFAS